MWSAATLSYLDRGADAVRHATKAIALTPFDPFLYYYDCVAALAHLAAGSLDEAIAFGRKSMQANPRFTATHRVLAIALTLQGEADEAAKVIRTLLAVEPAMTVSGFRRRFPASRPETLDRYATALLRAGVPP
ncbi:MAG: tetratricopeptide repeat protein [Alphaproteobacteria bacterium]|nr:tetratricopeptide repeat protein [Alphaproteobacteria bacterium]